MVRGCTLGHRETVLSIAVVVALVRRDERGARGRGQLLVRLERRCWRYARLHDDGERHDDPADGTIHYQFASHLLYRHLLYGVLFYWHYYHRFDDHNPCSVWAAGGRGPRAHQLSRA